MRNRWSEAEASVAQRADGQLGLLLYATRLLGAEADLALHGGGNTSLKTPLRDITGEQRPALFVKASGADMASAASNDFVALDLEYLRKLQTLADLTDEQMADEFRTHALLPIDRRPSIEALMHAFLDAKVVLHTHPCAVLALVNREDGALLAAQACPGALVIPYARVGFALATAVSSACARRLDAAGLIMMNHGLVTWGETVKAAYDATVAIVSAAETFLSSRRRPELSAQVTAVEQAQSRFDRLAPVIRGLLSPATGNADRPHGRVILQPLIDSETLRIVDSDHGRDLVLSQPLTPDYLIRTRRLPLWLDSPPLDDEQTFRTRMEKALTDYGAEYEAFVQRHGAAAVSDRLPRVVVVPGMGVVCTGPDAQAAGVAADIMRQTLLTKSLIEQTGGTFRGIDEEHLHDMEFRSFQRAKLGAASSLPLAGSVALVTGAAGAIGAGICRSLAAAGCHVAVTDLPGTQLDAAVAGLQAAHPRSVIGVALDVTDAQSVAAGFDAVCRAWGGVDLVVVNAGIAHVAPLVDLGLEAFRRLERVNVEGTLLLLAESARLFKRQNTGGDIVLISTKNVFAPGANFGAYSATKAASHQLARIASLEMAAMGVRVNMVAPDAVFSDGDRKSGLWATVGPDRMRARGLDEKGLEEYYRSRNLLKARVTADHVANAVLFFATHQTPTTGATIPVDGGLPDATPR